MMDKRRYNKFLTNVLTSSQISLEIQKEEITDSPKNCRELIKVFFCCILKNIRNPKPVAIYEDYNANLLFYEMKRMLRFMIFVL